MKLISNRLCRRRYKVQTKLRKWINSGGWGWNTGKPKANKNKDRNK